MPIAVVNVRLLNVSQDSHKKIPGCADMSSVFNRFIYPDDVMASPEELFEEFRKEADPTVFEEVEIPYGTTIWADTHQKAFVAFCKWLQEKGFRSFSDLEKELPVLKIPAQVTLTGLRPFRQRRAF